MIAPAVLIAGILLLVVSGGSIWLLVADTQQRALAERLAARSAVDDTSFEENLPSIRIAQPTTNFFLRLLHRLLKLRAGVREINPIPWPLVLVIGGGVGFAAMLALEFIAPSIVATLGGVFVAWFVTREIYRWEADRFAKKLFMQLPDAIELLVSAVSAGLPVTAALEQIAKGMPEPTGGEFRKVVAEIAVGRPADEALTGIYERSQVIEYAILAMTVGLQIHGGGRVAESSENLARIVRERVTVASRAMARSSEARLSGWVLSCLPIFFAIAISVLHPGYLHVFVTNDTARLLLGIGVILLLFGIVTMRGIIRWSLNE